ncbi:hypothetical protein [Beijerinckia indica]|uniref:Nucleotide modification associated domain-containing protein n=1 Tax=Beijerinckia indica subsp. indica (strain ATCC 9039 / DSM 1715 / NCIMB 8712) TaxID=395963 RepID=B2ILB5_BEII9|nr:hypothetical protein [Beijerinckia indica]ACB97315.1 conserved hypothetical protein [Beijerinckia indica subsp. indica ATCC 9039]
MPRLYSYVVRYDSGFAPNPFYGHCSLATCKPDIRKAAQIGDWVVGSGSNERRIKRGGYLVYALRVTGALSFQDYDADPRFAKKKPYRHGSRKQSCGDNIYFRNDADDEWLQRDSFHTTDAGERHPRHVARDTSVNRVLVSDHFVYFGGYGPPIPKKLVDATGRPLCKEGIGRNVFDDPGLIAAFEGWFDALGATGYQDAPYEWRQLRGGGNY